MPATLPAAHLLLQLLSPHTVHSLLTTYCSCCSAAPAAGQTCCFCYSHLLIPASTALPSSRCSYLLPLLIPGSVAHSCFHCSSLLQLLIPASAAHTCFRCSCLASHTCCCCCSHLVQPCFGCSHLLPPLTPASAAPSRSVHGSMHGRWSLVMPGVSQAIVFIFRPGHGLYFQTMPWSLFSDLAVIFIFRPGHGLYFQTMPLSSFLDETMV